MMYKRTVERLLESVDIRVIEKESEKRRDWDMVVRNPICYKRFLREGSLGLARTFIDGDWDTIDLVQFYRKVIKNDLRGKVKRDFPALSLGLLAKIMKPDILIRDIIWKLKPLITNPQNRRLSQRVAKQHYDLGNELYSRMLGSTMAYTCGVFKRIGKDELVSDLDEAQNTKFELVGRKAKLKPGMKVLDVGCGWGGLANYLAENFRVSVVGYNISHEQIKYAKEHNHNNVRFEEKDYRDAVDDSDKPFDVIVSIGNLEHVGRKNYRKYMKLIDNLLVPSGRLITHFIARKDSVSPGVVDRFIGTDIFPGGEHPSLAQILKAAEGLFIPEHVQNIGPDYALTLRCWWRNLSSKEREYSTKTLKRFQIYLNMCEAGFLERAIQLYQIVFSKGIPERYDIVV
ncbi:MAG: class I SAM-dependent methyltransferase [Nanoarchaeota archaeon]|nr:class I SAM-dependent methyltransferase [Nanoarchaeota archaeon]